MRAFEREMGTRMEVLLDVNLRMLTSKFVRSLAIDSKCSRRRDVTMMGV